VAAESASPDIVLAIATFFKAFSLKPIGRYPIRVCNGTACNIGDPCWWRWGELKITWDTTADNLFGLDTLNCVGCAGWRLSLQAGCARKVKISSIPRW
jgi:NADH:ubiquinone oxidoreductase subunit E